MYDQIHEYNIIVIVMVYRVNQMAHVHHGSKLKVTSPPRNAVRKDSFKFNFL